MAERGRSRIDTWKISNLHVGEKKSSDFSFDSSEEYFLTFVENAKDIANVLIAPSIDGRPNKKESLSV